MKLEYIIDGIRGFDMDTYLRAMKVRYDELSLFQKAQGPHLDADPNRAFIEESWESIQPLTPEEAFREPNQEKRRALFSCIGPSRLFATLSPTLVNRQVLHLQNKTWDKNGRKKVTEIEDIYELYEIEEKELFKGVKEEWWYKNNRTVLKVVRCWCTTTGREYWIFVENRKGQFWNGERNVFYPVLNTALDAIAWTFRIGIEKDDIEALYRQGDCLVVKARAGAITRPEGDWYFLDGKTYRDKLIAQS